MGWLDAKAERCAIAAYYGKQEAKDGARVWFRGHKTCGATTCPWCSFTKGIREACISYDFSMVSAAAMTRQFWGEESSSSEAPPLPPAELPAVPDAGPAGLPAVPDASPPSEGGSFQLVTVEGNGLPAALDLAERVTQLEETVCQLAQQVLRLQGLLSDC